MTSIVTALDCHPTLNGGSGFLHRSTWGWQSGWKLGLQVLANTVLHSTVSTYYYAGLFGVTQGETVELMEVWEGISPNPPPPTHHLSWCCPEHIALLINANQYLFNRKCHVVDSLVAILLLFSQLELHELPKDLKIQEGATRGNVKPFVFIKFRRAKGCLLEG